MFHLVSRRIAALRSRQAFNASTAPCMRIALDDGRAVCVYRFHGERLIFDASHDWRFIAALPWTVRRCTIVQVATAYVRGFEQGQGQLSDLGLTAEFMAMARRYVDDLAASHNP